MPGGDAHCSPFLRNDEEDGSKVQWALQFSEKVRSPAKKGET